MYLKYLIITGGVMHICFALFDMTWAKAFNWKESLSSLDETNRSLLRLTNKLLIVIYLGFAYLSLFHSEELLRSHLGKAVLGCIALYWTARTIMQPVYFDMKEKVTVLFFIIFTGMISLYVIPIIYHF